MALDPSMYTRAPMVTAASGAALARALVGACPPGMPASVKGARARLERAADEAAEVLGERPRGGAAALDEDARLLDQECDTSWGALRGRLLAWTLLPPDRFPRSERATQLIARLFGSSGLTFLQSGYATQSAVAEDILRRIDEGGLQPEIDQLAGPEFLAHVRHTHERYAAMAAARQRGKAAESSGNLVTHTRALQDAIVAYATEVCATIDAGDPATEAAAAAALRPIDAFREESARRLSARPPSNAPPPARGGGQGEGAGV
ncbi:MAG TPA: hypothetical protein VFS43_14100 [Polyangiaceae bacterium]|nr:hypothetical protein [Polyangiaceae bacterium]